MDSGRPQGRYQNQDGPIEDKNSINDINEMNNIQSFLYTLMNSAHP